MIAPKDVEEMLDCPTEELNSIFGDQYIDFSYANLRLHVYV